VGASLRFWHSNTIFPSAVFLNYEIDGLSFFCPLHFISAFHFKHIYPQVLFFGGELVALSDTLVDQPFGCYLLTHTPDFRMK